jgi:VIT1/CCC1 family predicted Fe2+/Mn2+ transporter
VQSSEVNGGTIRQREAHRSGRSGWLRAAVLGSNDAIVSTASLMVGVAAASASRQAILIAGVAGLVAGSMSMAVGEYVSVSAQRDSEQADIELERQELAVDPRAELNELAMIYVKRGLEKELAMKVAQQLSARDRLGSHMRDELGIETGALARPLQAAWISATSFASFAAVPIAALPYLPSIAGHSRDLSVVPGQPRCSWCIWRPFRWRAARPCGVARDNWRRLGDGSDSRHRPTPWCFSGLMVG